MRGTLSGGIQEKCYAHKQLRPARHGPLDASSVPKEMNEIMNHEPCTIQPTFSDTVYCSLCHVSKMGQRSCLWTRHQRQ
jgi:hypothetical protein